MPSSANKPATASLPTGAVRRDVERHRGGVVAHVADAIAEEIPVAFVYNERPHAVMLSTPPDFEDFALGFSLSEAIIAHAGEFESVEVVPALAGIELRIRVPEPRAAVLDERVRQLTGRTGCGLCGAQTLEAAIRHPAAVAEPTPIDTAALHRALAGIKNRQTINVATGATHAAAWASSDGEVLLAREDVGRHNALDKVTGALARAGTDPSAGFLVMTSRASYELVQKASVAGVPVLAAVSRPTGLAIRLAEAAGLTLIALLRGRSANVYTHPERLTSV
jgi:FdhD protein